MQEHPLLHFPRSCSISPPSNPTPVSFSQSNGSEVLSVDYDPVTLRQTVYTPSGDPAAGATRQVALSVKYKESVKPDTWSPAGLPQMFVSYDRSERRRRDADRAGWKLSGVGLSGGWISVIVCKSNYIFGYCSKAFRNLIVSSGFLSLQP